MKAFIRKRFELGCAKVQPILLGACIVALLFVVSKSRVEVVSVTVAVNHRICEELCVTECVGDAKGQEWVLVVARVSNKRPSRAERLTVKFGRSAVP